MSAARAFFPSPRMRGEGTERRRRETGEGAIANCPSPGHLRFAPAADLSPQAGRGEGCYTPHTRNFSPARGEGKRVTR